MGVLRPKEPDIQHLLAVAGKLQGGGRDTSQGSREKRVHTPRPRVDQGAVLTCFCSFRECAS